MQGNWRYFSCVLKRGTKRPTNEPGAVTAKKERDTKEEPCDQTSRTEGLLRKGLLSRKGGMKSPVRKGELKVLLMKRYES